MSKTDESEIQRALVRTLRSGALHAQLPGGEHETVAPRGTSMPFLTYSMVPSATADDFTGRQLRTLWDIWITASDQAVANSLASLMKLEVEDNLQPVTGQSILQCRYVSGLRDKEITDEDRIIYRMGGTFAIWTDQPLNADVFVTASETLATSDTT